MKISRNRASNFSVVFFVVLSFLIFPPQAFSQNQFPKPVGHVNDFANVIPPATERKIAAICLEVKQKTGAEIAILTVDTIGDNITPIILSGFSKMKIDSLGSKAKITVCLFFKPFKREN